MHRRRFIVVALAVALAACGKDSPTQPQKGTLSFRTDPASCGAGTVELFIDGVSQGAFVFNPPGSFRDFEVTAGSHTAGAKEVGGTGLIFPSATVTVPANGKYTQVLICQ